MADPPTAPEGGSPPAVPGLEAVVTEGVYKVPEAIAADCSRPVEKEIMQWIAAVPNRSTIVFGAGKCYGQDESITLDDRSGLIIDGNGSTFKALTAGAPTRSNWRIRSGADITIKNMIVRGSNTERKFHYPLGWQHGYAFQGTRNGLLESVEAHQVYGDFVEAQHDSRDKNMAKAAPASNIVVRNSRFDLAGRMGIGLTSVDGFVMENSSLDNVALSGVDLETDVVGQKARNIRIVGNTFGIVSHGIFLNIGKGWSPDVGEVLVADNVMNEPPSTCYPAIVIRPPLGKYRSGYTFRNNRLITHGDGFRFSGLRNVEIVGNNVQHAPGDVRCPSTNGTMLSDSHAVGIVDNTFVNAQRSLRRDSRSTEIRDQNNRIRK